MPVFRKISCLITNAGVAAKSGKKILENDLGLIANAALVFDHKRGVLWMGHDAELPKNFKEKKWRHHSCHGLTAYPGLVDSHTHPLFLGDRSREFELRMRGASYQEIFNAGGGISLSVTQTRAGSLKNLKASFAKRMQEASNFGVRLMEAKSGYGLDLKNEIKSLAVIKGFQKENNFIKIIPTCLAAHAIPPEHKNDRQKYLTEIKEKIIPAVAKKKLASYVDVFCDRGYFSVEETLQIFQCALSHGLSIRAHGEELSQTGIAERAAAMGAHSVDHLLKISDEGIKAMAAFGSVGILLPGTSFYLKEAPAPARKMIDQGMIVALATDFNPGTCPTQNLPLIGSLAAIHLGMTTAEIVASITWNAARSLRNEHLYGALLPGFLGKPAFTEGDHPSSLFYHLAPSRLADPES